MFAHSSGTVTASKHRQYKLVFSLYPFKAYLLWPSARAYKLKLDAWNCRKYKIRRKKKICQRTSPQRSGFEPSSEASIDNSRETSACVTSDNPVPGNFEHLDGDLCLLEPVELLLMDEPRIDIAFDSLVDCYGMDAHIWIKTNVTPLGINGWALNLQASSKDLLFVLNRSVENIVDYLALFSLEGKHHISTRILPHSRDWKLTLEPWTWLDKDGLNGDITSGKLRTETEILLEKTIRYWYESRQRTIETYDETEKEVQSISLYPRVF